MTGCAGSIGVARPAGGVDPALAVALPVQRRLGAGVLHEGDVRAVGDRGSIDLEGGELDRVPRRARCRRRSRARERRSRTRRPRSRPSPGPHRAHSTPACGPKRVRTRSRRQLVAVDQLQQLQHRLVVLQLVGEQHLVDEPFPQQRVLDLGTDLHALQYVERALADVRHVGAQLLVAQDRQLAADLARVLDRVVEAAELAVQRLAPADRLHQPELLEVGDVAEVPGQRAEDRRVDRVQLLVVERLDQGKSPLPRLGKSFRDRCLRH